MGGPADPMKKMRETVATLRRMIEGGKTNPKVVGKTPLYLAGVSRPMVRLAGEIADGVIFNFFPPARIKEALGEIAEGAQKAGRNASEIVPTMFATAFISDDIDLARKPARTLLSRYGALRFYGNMFAHAGFDREIEGIRAAGKDGKAAIAAVTDKMIDSTLLVGSEGRVRDRLAELAVTGDRMGDRLHQSGGRGSRQCDETGATRAQAVASRVSRIGTGDGRSFVIVGAATTAIDAMYSIGARLTIPATRAAAALFYSDLLQKDVLSGFAGGRPRSGCDACRKQWIGTDRSAALERLFDCGGHTGLREIGETLEPDVGLVGVVDFDFRARVVGGVLSYLIVSAFEQPHVVRDRFKANSREIPDVLIASFSGKVTLYGL